MSDDASLSPRGTRADAAFSRAWSERLKRGTNSSQETSGRRWNLVFFFYNSPRPFCASAILRRVRVTSRWYVANSWAWSNVFPTQFTVSTARCICSQSRVRFKCEFMMRPTRSLYPRTRTLHSVQSVLDLLVE